MIKVIERLLIAMVWVVAGYLLAIFATMGPTIAPEVWRGKLDALIRIGLLAIGFAGCVAALIWLIWPILRYLGQRLREIISDQS